MISQQEWDRSFGLYLDWDICWTAGRQLSKRWVRWSSDPLSGVTAIGR